MLSVLIPTYNYKCYTLVNDIQQQLEQTDEQYEIIVAEDGGKDQVTAISNLRINDVPNSRFIRRQENVGRAAIRNFLATEAKGEWLLFMDSDAMIVEDNFIRNFLDAAKKGSDVICGEIVHPDECPSAKQSLRWKYEKDYEIRMAGVDDCFRSFCFMIKADVFSKVKFNDKYCKYGWEDVQFGIDLNKCGFTIANISNKLLNNDIETNEKFLKKTEEALCTLSTFADDLHDEVLLLRTVKRIKELHLIWAVRLVFAVTRGLQRRNLLGSNPNLKIYAFYKLGYFLSKYKA